MYCAAYSYRAILGDMSTRGTGSVHYLAIGARVQWVSSTGMRSATYGTILPDPETSRTYPVDPEGFECPELRWVRWDDDTNGPDLVGVDELTTDA